ncbi:MAG: hypothetical protein JXB45_11890 [Candidatus Krumholzibacteriota bacterium]|nr:hypothetical protein [Candidatus Krumholzibacteriota bacterium]
METTTTTTRETTIKDFLEVIFRRKWIVVGMVSVSTIIVLYLNLREPAVYEASGRVLVKRGEAIGVFSNYVRTLSWEEEIASQIEMIKSQIVIGRAQELIGEYLPAEFETEERINPGRVSSGVITTSNVLYIAYTGRNPVFCEAAVNAIIHAYKEYYQRTRTPPEMEDFFSHEIVTYKEEMEYWRNLKSRLEKEWGIVDIDVQRKSTLLRLDKYQNDLDEISTSMSEIEAVIIDLEKALELNPDEQFALITNHFQFGGKKTVIDNLKENLTTLEMEESEMSASFTDDYPELVKVRRQKEDIYRKLDQEIRSIITMKRSTYNILNNKSQVIADIMRQIEEDLDKFPQREIELNRIAAALARVESGYDNLIEQQMNSRITTASNPEWTVTILSQASPAYQKRTRDYVRIALGPLFSLIVSLGFAFFMDNLDHSIKNVSEAEDALGFRVLASFPEAKR